MLVLDSFYNDTLITRFPFKGKSLKALHGCVNLAANQFAMLETSNVKTYINR